MYSFPPFEKLWDVVSPTRTQSRTTSAQNVLYWFLQKVCTYLCIRGIVRTLCRNLYLLLRDKRDGVRVCVLYTYAYTALRSTLHASLVVSPKQRTGSTYGSIAVQAYTHTWAFNAWGDKFLKKQAGRAVYCTYCSNTETCRHVTRTTYSLLY